MKNAFIRIALTALVATLALAPTSIAQTQSGKLKVGAARVDITPPINPDYPPSGKYAHEKLYIRAIVLDNGVELRPIVAEVPNGSTYLVKMLVVRP